MQATLPDIPIIRTTVLKRIETLFELAADRAELVTVKGPAGIGKTFAIDHIAKNAKSIDVFTVTARTEIAGNIRWMANEILKPHRVQQFQTPESMEVVWNLVARRPFAAYPSRSVLIIDEAQALKPSVLESLRGLFDMGKMARAFGGQEPAFGMLLVGNSTFLNRAGGSSRAAYEPFLQRVEIQQEFGRPTRDDYELFVDGLPNLDPQSRNELVELGMSKGSIRAVWKVWRSATLMASGGSISTHLLQTISRMKGRV